MKEKGKRKFLLGDIIQKLNEAKAASGEPVTNEPDPATPEVPAPSPVRPRMFPRSLETAAALPTETATRLAPNLPPQPFRISLRLHLHSPAPHLPLRARKSPRSRSRRRA